MLQQSKSKFILVEGNMLRTDIAIKYKPRKHDFFRSTGWLILATCSATPTWRSRRTSASS